MSGNSKDIESGAPQEDAPLPTDAELDALQAEINKALDGVESRDRNRSGRGHRLDVHEQERTDGVLGPTGRAGARGRAGRAGA